jgi:hypothetical protein
MPLHVADFFCNYIEFSFEHFPFSFHHDNNGGFRELALANFNDIIEIVFTFVGIERNHEPHVKCGIFAFMDINRAWPDGIQPFWRQPFYSEIVLNIYIFIVYRGIGTELFVDPAISLMTAQFQMLLLVYLAFYAIQYFIHPSVINGVTRRIHEICNIHALLAFTKPHHAGCFIARHLVAEAAILVCLAIDLGFQGIRYLRELSFRGHGWPRQPIY